MNSKIAILIILCFIFMPLSVFAQEAAPPQWAEDDQYLWPDEDVEWPDGDEEELPQKKGGLYMEDREIEVVLFDVSAGLSNDFLSTSEIFKETIVIDLDLLGKGLNMNFGFAMTPIAFNYNKAGLWGFGISTGMDFTGNLGLSGKMLTFDLITDPKDGVSDLNAAAFATIGLSGFFHLDKFKIKINPSFFYPIVYMKPDKFSYSFTYTEEGGSSESKLNLDMAMRVYTAFPIDGDFSLTATPGVDWHFGAEYPLAEVLGLRDKFSFLDFIVGVDIINLPMVPGTMKDYMEVAARIGGDKPIDFFGDEGMNFDDFLSVSDSEDSIFGEEKRNILRPFKMLFWADWKPFGTELISFVPTLGFAINPLFDQKGSFEGSIKACLNVYNLFLASLGIGYHDRLWKNSLDLALNLRAIQWDFGLSLQAPKFVKSWSGGGFGFRTGLRVGW
jgi:hypothetical protein